MQHFRQTQVPIVLTIVLEGLFCSHASTLLESAASFFCPFLALFHGISSQTHSSLWGGLLVFMAKSTPSARFVLPVTFDTAGHFGDIGNPSRHIHFRQLSVTHFACHLCFDVRTVAPINPSRQNIHADPGNGLAGLGIGRQFLDRRFFLSDGRVARHAFGFGRKGHSIAGFRIAMTIFAE